MERIEKGKKRVFSSTYPLNNRLGKLNTYGLSIPLLGYVYVFVGEKQGFIMGRLNCSRHFSYARIAWAAVQQCLTASHALFLGFTCFFLNPARTLHSIYDYLESDNLEKIAESYDRFFIIICAFFERVHSRQIIQEVNRIGILYRWKTHPLPLTLESVLNCTVITLERDLTIGGEVEWFPQKRPSSMLLLRDWPSKAAT